FPCAEIGARDVLRPFDQRRGALSRVGGEVLCRVENESVPRINWTGSAAFFHGFLLVMSCLNQCPSSKKKPKSQICDYFIAGDAPHLRPVRRVTAPLQRPLPPVRPRSRSQAPRPGPPVPSLGQQICCTPERYAGR